MSLPLPRRAVLAGAAAVALLSRPGSADAEPIDVSWNDLIPDSGGIDMDALRQMGVIQHGQLSTPFDQTKASAITTEYNGKRIRIPGYMVPLDYAGTGVTSFILVPYVGACIHVPPPPANQMIFVTNDKPYDVAGLFEAVYVTGTMAATATNTQLAEIAYNVTADEIRPYK